MVSVSFQTFGDAQVLKFDHLIKGTVLREIQWQDQIGKFVIFKERMVHQTRSLTTAKQHGIDCITIVKPNCKITKNFSRKISNASGGIYRSLGTSDMGVPCTTANGISCCCG